MIYLDNAATTIPSENAVLTAQEYCTNFFNPSSIYLPAIKIAKDIQGVRSLILNLIGDSSGGIIFTSGATEANNLAIFQATKNKNKVIITTLGEHPSVFNSVKNLESSGFEVHYVGLKPSGDVDFDQLKKIISENDVGFVSVMFVNNETGAINPIKEIGSFIKRLNKNIIFHVDAVQAFTKIPINVKEMGIDLLTISAHKIHGLKGVGALYHSNAISIKPLAFGGGQEFGKRSGTENVSGIMAFGKACDENNIINPNLKSIAKNQLSLLDEIKINGDGLNNIISVSCRGVKAEVVVRKLEEFGVYISTGSACNSHKADNRVLNAMGISKEFIEGTNRFSFSKYTKEEEVKFAFECYVKIIKELKRL